MMKKYLLNLLVIAAMMLLPSVMVAQNCSFTITSANPFVESFEGVTGSTYNAAGVLPDCWSGYSNGTTAAYVPHVTGSGSYWYPQTGTNCLSMTSGGSTYGSVKYVMLPAVTNPLSTLQLSFWMSTESSGSGTLYVGYFTSDDTSTFTPFMTLPASLETYHTNGGTLVETFLSQVPASATRIGFKWTYTTSYYTCCIDDVTLSLLPACPRVSSLAMQEVGSSYGTFNWVENGSATSWTVLYDTVYPISSSAQSTTVYTPSCTLTGLEPSHTYYVSVTPTCFDGDAQGREISFTTRCAAVAIDDLPFTYGFEDATASGTSGNISSCWGRYRVGSTTNYPYPSTTQKRSGSYGLYFYNSTTVRSWLVLPDFEEDLTELQLSFWGLKTSASYGPLIVGVMSNPEDLSTFDTIQQVSVGSLSTWELFEIPLSGYTGNGTHLAILAGANATNYVYIDDILVDYIPTCVRPTDLAAANITTNSVDLSWNSTADSWLIEYGPVGFQQGLGTEEEVFSNNYTLSGLSSGTNYTVYVRAVCGSDTTLPTTVNFTTVCGTLDLPYTNSFEGYPTGSGAAVPFPTCFARINDATGSYNYYPYCNSSTTNAHTGSNYMYFYLTTTSGYADNQYMVLPPVDTNANAVNSLEVSFFARYNTNPTNLVVGVMTDPTDATTFTPVQTVNVSSSTYSNYTVSLRSFGGYGSYIALKASRGTSTAYIYLDDISVYEASNCATPLDLRLTSVSNDGFSVTWSDTANVGSYYVYYGMPGFDRDTVTPEQVSDTTFTTTEPLMANTDYEVVVIADCGSELSNATYPIVVRTACDPFPADSLPYMEDFESYASGSTATIDPCWKKGTSSATAYPYPYSTTPVTGQRSLYFYSSATAYCFAAMPAFETDLNSLQLNFNFKNYSTISSTTGSALIVGVMSNPEDIATFEPYEMLTFPTEQPSAVIPCEIAFDRYQGEGRYIAFLAPTTDQVSITTNYVRIDDIVVDSIPSCRRSTNLTVENVTSTSADLSWVNSSEFVPSYTVAYSTDAACDPSAATTLTVTAYDTTVTLTNLANFTHYYFRVKANCAADAPWSAVCAFTTLVDCGPGNVENILDTIGDGTTAGYTYLAYAYTSYARGYTASIFSAQELANMGLLSNNRINGLSFHAGSTAGTVKGFKIFMKEVDEDIFPTTPANDTAAIFAGMTKVFDGSFTTQPEQWVDVSFDTAFEYHGTKNLLIRYVRDSIPTASTTFYYTSATPDYRSVYGYASGTTGNLSCTRSYYRTNVAFNVCVEIPSCERPNNAHVAALTDQSAEFQWDGVATDNYQYLISTDSQLDTTATPSAVVGNSVVVNGLAPQTTYHFWVRQACQGGAVSDWSIPVSFTTPCSPVSLPYSEDFESYSSGSSYGIDPCWTKHALGTTTNYPYPYTSAAINSTRGLYFYSYTPSSTTTAKVSSWASLPMFDAPIDSIELRFDMKRYSTTTAYYTTEMYVGVMVDPNDISTFDTVAYFNMKDDPAGQIRSFEADFSNYQGSGRFITFLALPPTVAAGATYAYNYAYLDNVEVVRVASCRRPNNVAVVDSTITTTSATVTWTGRTANPLGYEVSCAPLGSNAATIMSTTATQMQLTGLHPSTRYEVKVRVICAAGDTSDWSPAAYFYTTCGGIDQLPVFFDFENEATGTSSPLPYCWTRINDATGTSNYYPYINNSSTYAHSGTNVLYFYSATTTSYADTMIAVLPEFAATIPANTLEVSFYARTMSASYLNSTIKVGVMSDPTDKSTFVPSREFQLTTENQFYSVDLTGNSSNGHYVAFLMSRDASSAAYAYVDDITVDFASPCPRAYDLAAASVSQNAATLAWSDSSNAAGYVVTYWPMSNPSAATVVSATDTIVAISGLTPATYYEFDVNPICQTGDTAFGARFVGRFATSQVPATLPYAYDFENGAEWNNWQTSSNNSVAWYRGTANAAQGQYAMYVSADNGLTQSTNMNAIVNAVAYRDVDFGTTPSSFTLTFKASVGGTTDANYDGMSIVLADPATYVESSATGLISPWGHVNNVALRTIRRDSAWTTYEVHFDNISGIQRVAFYWFNQSTGASHPFEFGPVAVDSISIAEMTCQRPYDLYVDNLGTNSATLNWTGETNATYTVIYREYPGSPSMNQTVTVSNATSYQLQNLNNNTEYAFWVRKNCSSTNESPSSVGIRFTTACAVYSAADTIREDFSDFDGVAYNEAGELPACWLGLSNGTNANFVPHVVSSGTYWYAHGAKSLIMTSGSETYGDTKIVRLPLTAEPVSSLTLSYWMCTESSSSGTLSVGYMTGDEMTDFVPIRSIPASSATMHSSTGNMGAGIGVYDTVSFSEVPANALYVAFRWVYTSSFFSVCIDDVELTSNLVCSAPVVTVSNVDYESADLTWTSTGTSYEVAVAVHGEAWQDAVSVSANSYHVTGLMPNTEYDYRVRQLCDSTLTSNWTEGSFTTEDLPCYIPTNVTASNATVTGITISWTDDAQSNAQSWIVNIFNATSNIMDTVSTNPATISGLYDNTQYSVAVKARCATLVFSDWSDTVTFTTATCSVVSNVQVSNVTTNGATVTWTAGASETAWEVNYGRSGFGEGQGTIAAVTSTTYQITGLEEDEDYDVYVRAKCAEGIYSDWSPVQTFTTLKTNVDGIDGVDGNYSLSIYPNPATSNTTISLRGIEGEVTVTVVDMNGRTISSDVMNCGADCVKTMTVDGLAQGTYFVRVLGDGINSVRKLIVR